MTSKKLNVVNNLILKIKNTIKDLSEEENTYLTIEGLTQLIFFIDQTQSEINKLSERVIVIESEDVTSLLKEIAVMERTLRQMKLNAITKKSAFKLVSPNRESNYSFKNSISSQNEFNISQAPIVSSSVSDTSAYPLFGNPHTSIHDTNANSPTSTVARISPTNLGSVTSITPLRVPVSAVATRAPASYNPLYTIGKNFPLNIRNKPQSDKKVPVINSFHSEINSKELGFEKAAFSKTSKSIQNINITHHTTTLADIKHKARIPFKTGSQTSIICTTTFATKLNYARTNTTVSVTDSGDKIVSQIIQSILTTAIFMQIMLVPAKLTKFESHGFSPTYISSTPFRPKNA